MEIRIFQKSPVFPNLFLIYINKVFLKIKILLPLVICLLFIDDLRFLTTDHSIIDIKKILKKARKIIFN